jgi:large subunit ribosomal protein L30
MIAVIRISGIPEMPRKAASTLDKLRLRKKFVCVLLQETGENLGMIRAVDNFTAYGKINKETLIELLKARGKLADGKKGKIDAEKVAGELLEGKTQKKLSDFGIKPFFAMHPPRGGIDSKKHYPKGVLGNHQDKISELIRRML